MKMGKWSAPARFLGTLLLMACWPAGLACAGSPEPAGGVRSAVAAALDGKLIKWQNGAAVPAAVQGDPEYFVLYHSASW